MRLRFPELFEELGLTALQVARRSRGRINQSTVYRWQQLHGRVRTLDCETIEDLCDALGVGLMDVVELERPARRHEQRR